MSNKDELQTALELMDKHWAGYSNAKETIRAALQGQTDHFVGVNNMMCTEHITAETRISELTELLENAGITVETSMRKKPEKIEGFNMSAFVDDNIHLFKDAEKFKLMWAKMVGE